MWSTLATIVLVINELMASNVGTAMSPATNFDSWIELYNPSDQPVDLTGMFLSDEPGNPTRWCMPSNIGSVPAKGFKVIWLGSNEIKNNQAEMSGIYEAADFCSAGYKVGWLGQSEKNDLLWRNVYSNNGGEYQLTIGFISGENRNITVSVNGEKVKTISANSGGWQKVGTKTVTIQLQKGQNTIRLSNTTNWLPDIDYIELLSTASSAIHPISMQSQEDDTLYDLSGRKITNPQKGIYINNHRKVLKN